MHAVSLHLPTELSDQKSPRALSLQSRIMDAKVIRRLYPPRRKQCGSRRSRRGVEAHRRKTRHRVGHGPQIFANGAQPRDTGRNWVALESWWRMADYQSRLPQSHSLTGKKPISPTASRWPISPHSLISTEPQKTQTTHRIHFAIGSRTLNAPFHKRRLRQKTPAFLQLLRIGEVMQLIARLYKRR
jgi:hypothetical protein